MKSITRTHIIKIITFMQRAVLFGSTAALLLMNWGMEWPWESAESKRIQADSNTMNASFAASGKTRHIATVAVSSWRLPSLEQRGEAASHTKVARIYTHDPKSNPYALNNLALIFIQRGWFNEAVALLEKAVAQKPDVAFFHHNLGIALQYTGNFHKALAAFQAALMIDPYYVKAQISLNEVEKQLRLNREYPSAMSVAE